MGNAPEREDQRKKNDAAVVWWCSSVTRCLSFWILHYVNTFEQREWAANDSPLSTTQFPGVTVWSKKMQSVKKKLTLKQECMIENAPLTLIHTHSHTGLAQRSLSCGNGGVLLIHFAHPEFRIKSSASLTFRPPLPHVVAWRSAAIYNSVINNSLSQQQDLTLSLTHEGFPTWLNRNWNFAN